jgi:DNA-binding NarL/FixJ family response regulator
MANNERHNPLQGFSRHEREILKLVANGYVDDQIADELSMSERTVKEIQVKLMRKWNVHTISSAIDYALGNGLMTLYEILESRFQKRKLEVSRGS